MAWNVVLMVQMRSTSAARSSIAKLFNGPRVLGLSLLALGLMGCGMLRNGASSENLWRAKQRFPQGANTYHVDCAHCHGMNGAGEEGRPRLMGPGALPIQQYLKPQNRTEMARAGRVGGAEGAVEQQIRRRPNFNNAADVHRFIAEWMPAPHVSAGSLSEQEYWAVLNFILEAHGVALPAEGVTPANASTVSVSADGR